MKRLDHMINKAIEKRATILARKLVLDALTPKRTKRGSYKMRNKRQAKN